MRRTTEHITVISEWSINMQRLELKSVWYDKICKEYTKVSAYLQFISQSATSKICVM